MTDEVLLFQAQVAKHALDGMAAFFRSEHGHNPLARMYEDGELGNWEDYSEDWDDVLSAIEWDERNVVSDPDVDPTIVGLARAVFQATHFIHPVPLAAELVDKAQDGNRVPGLERALGQAQEWAQEQYRLRREEQVSRARLQRVIDGWLKQMDALAQGYDNQSVFKVTATELRTQAAALRDAIKGIWIGEDDLMALLDEEVKVEIARERAETERARRRVNYLRGLLLNHIEFGCDSIGVVRSALKEKIDAPMPDVQPAGDPGPGGGGTVVSVPESGV